MNLDYILDHNDLSMPTTMKSVAGLDGKIEVMEKTNKSPPPRNKKGAKRKRKNNSSKDELKKPPRPFTEYTVFFQLEREYIMQTVPGVDTTPQQQEDVYLPPSHHPKMPARYADLVFRSDWYVSGKKKERRRHRKTHGKIGFLELTRTISQRWSIADEEIKAYCKQMALLELDKYKAAMNLYTAKKICQKEDQQQGGDEAKHLGDPSSSLRSVSQLVNSLCSNNHSKSIDDDHFYNFKQVEPSSCSTRSLRLLSSAEGNSNGGQHQHDELLDILTKASEIGRGNIESSRSSETTEKEEEASAASYSHNKMSSFSLKSSLSRQALYDMRASPMFGGQDFTKPYDTQYDGKLKGHLLSSAFPSSFHNKHPSNILDKYSGSSSKDISHDSDVEVFLQRLEDEEDFHRGEEEIVPRGSEHNHDESTTNVAIGSVTMVDDTEILNLWDGLAC